MGKKINTGLWCALRYCFLISLSLPTPLWTQAEAQTLADVIADLPMWSTPSDEDYVLQKIKALKQEYNSTLNRLYFLNPLFTSIDQTQISRRLNDVSHFGRHAIYYAALKDYPIVLAQLEQEGVHFDSEENQEEIYLALCKKLEFRSHFSLNTPNTVRFLAARSKRLDVACRNSNRFLSEQVLEVLLFSTHPVLSKRQSILKFFNARNKSQSELTSYLLEILETLRVSGANLFYFKAIPPEDLIAEAVLYSYDMSLNPVAANTPEDPLRLVNYFKSFMTIEDTTSVQSTLLSKVAKVNSYSLMKKMIDEAVPLLEPEDLKSITQIALLDAALRWYHPRSTLALLENPALHFDREFIIRIQNTLLRRIGRFAAKPTRLKDLQRILFSLREYEGQFAARRLPTPKYGT